jgi:uncharacterized protein
MPLAELSQLDLSSRHLADLRALLERHAPDAEVWAFGSRVTGGAHEGSDLDLVLRNGQDLRRRVAGLADLLEALQASGLPMLVEVHDWSQLPQAFCAEIERGHAVVRAARTTA